MQKNLTLTFIKFIIISLLTLAIPTIAIEKYQLYSITLTENSILYIYSTIAQVVAGLMALTLVAVPYLFTLLEKKYTTRQWLGNSCFYSKAKCF